MDVFVTGQRAELVDAGLDVVAGDRLALSDRRQVDLVLDRLVGLDCLVGYATPSRCCARITAIHSSRSSTTLRSGDQTSFIASLA